MKSSNPPHTLHIISGPPASGKSTFAQNLAKSHAATLLDIDTSTEPIIKAALSALEMDPNDRDSTRFKQIFRNPIYEALFETAKANLPHTDVIIAGPFTTESQNAGWLDFVAKTIAIPCRISAIYLTCSEPELRLRMKKRANPRDRSKIENWDNYWAYFKNSGVPEYPHTLIDTSAR